MLWSPPAVLAARLPGLGHAYQEHLMTYHRMAPFDVIIACEHSRGTVRAKRSGWDPDIRFDFGREDMDRFQRGLSLSVLARAGEQASATPAWGDSRRDLSRLKARYFAAGCG